MLYAAEMARERELVARTVDFAQEFSGEEMDVALECYPLESVKGFEVKEEDSVEVEGKIKNPDYSFRLFDSSIGSMKRKFFMEVSRNERKRPRWGSAAPSRWRSSSRAKNSCVRSCASSGE